MNTSIWGSPEFWPRNPLNCVIIWALYTLTRITDRSKIRLNVAFKYWITNSKTKQLFQLNLWKSCLTDLSSDFSLSHLKEAFPQSAKAENAGAFNLQNFTIPYQIWLVSTFIFYESANTRRNGKNGEDGAWRNSDVLREIPWTFFFFNIALTRHFSSLPVQTFDQPLDVSG